MVMEVAQQLEKENEELKGRVSSLEADNARILASEQRRKEVERTNADLIVRNLFLEEQASTDHYARTKMMEIAQQVEKENADLKCRASSLEKENASMLSSEQRRQELERTDAELMMRIQVLETKASTEHDAYDAKQYHAKMMETTTNEEENTDLDSTGDSLEADNASISSSEQRRQERERTNADLMIRIQGLEAQVSTEHDAYTKMAEIAIQFQNENADLKSRVNSPETDHESTSSLEQRRLELEQTNADLMMRIQALETKASTEQEAYDAMQRKVAEFEQDVQDAMAKAQQTHELQEKLAQRNRELQEKVEYEKSRSIATDQAEQDKMLLHAMSASLSARPSSQQTPPHVSRSERVHLVSLSAWRPSPPHVSRPESVQVHAKSPSLPARPSSHQAPPHVAWYESVQALTNNKNLSRSLPSLKPVAGSGSFPMAHVLTPRSRQRYNQWQG
jgi:hypothetical protein